MRRNAAKEKRKYLMARGLLWGRMLGDLELAVQALKVVSINAQELLTPEGAKLAKTLHETAAEFDLGAWAAYQKAKGRLR